MGHFFVGHGCREAFVTFATLLQGQNHDPLRGSTVVMAVSKFAPFKTSQEIAFFPPSLLSLLFFHGFVLGFEKC